MLPLLLASRHLFTQFVSKLTETQMSNNEVFKKIRRVFFFQFYIFVLVSLGRTVSKLPAKTNFLLGKSVIHCEWRIQSYYRIIYITELTEYLYLVNSLLEMGKNQSVLIFVFKISNPNAFDF